MIRALHDRLSGRATTKLVDRTRAQTLQDYTLGIGVFILTVAFVVSFIPSILTPFTAPVDDGMTARADRSAAALTYSLSSTVHPNQLDPAETQRVFTEYDSSDDLREYLALSQSTNINVSIRDPQTEEPATIAEDPLLAGDPYGDVPTAASSRIVSINGKSYTLTVRLW